MRALRLSLYFLLGLLLGAYTVISNAGVVHYSSSGSLIVSQGGIPSTINFAPNPGGGITGSSVVSNSITSGKVPVTVPVTVSQNITGRAIAGIVTGAARGTIGGIVVGAAISGIMDKARITCDFDGCRRVPAPGTIQMDETPAETVPAQPYWSGDRLHTDGSTIGSYYNGSSLSEVGQQMCAYRASTTSPPQSATFIGYNASYGRADCTFSSWGYSTGGHLTQRCPAGSSSSGSSPNMKCSGTTLSCPANGGWVKSGSMCVRTPCGSGQIRDSEGQCQIAALSDDEALTAVQPHVSSPEGVDVLTQAKDANVPIPADPPKVSGPAAVTSSPIQSTTTINNTTNTTTTTTTVNNTYQGGTHSYTVTNTSTTTNAAGEVLSTTKDDVPDEPPVVVSDTPLGDVPKLYERKYPDGLVGVWNARSAELKATPLFGLTAIFTPNISAGSCPSWTVNANIGPHMMFGSGSISPPCWVWPAIKAIIIISALLLARRLIFGG